MKKILLLTKSFVILSLLFCSVGVFAGDEREPIVLSKTPTDNVPKTINVQGKLTTDSGGPITAGAQEIKLKIYGKNSETPIKTSSTTANVDSDGIYTANIDVKTVDFSKPLDFEVVAGNVTSSKTPFSSSPYAFYASSSTWAQGDSRNQMIADTYIKDLKVYQTSMTITKGDGTHIPRDFIRASTYTFGIVKVGKGLDVSGEGVISVNSGVHVETATYAQYDYIGQEIATNYIKNLSVSGSTITIHKGDNTTTSDIPLAAATNSAWGVVSVPTSDYGLSLSSGAITISSASANQYGTVKVSSAITSDGTNVVYSSAIYSVINATYTALNNSKANTDALYSIAFKTNISSGSVQEGDVLAWNGNKWEPTSFGSVSGNIAAGHDIRITSRQESSWFGPKYTYYIHLDTAALNTIPEAGSSEPITSGAVYTALSGKQATLGSSNVITTGEGNVVDSVTALNGTITVTKNTTLAEVATSGSYNDLSDKPTIPAAPVQSNWAETNTESLAYISNKPDLAEVATSGSYNDLSDKPTIPTVTNSYVATSTEAISGQGVKVALDTLVSGSFTPGTGLERVGNTVNVTTAPYAQQIDSGEDIGAMAQNDTAKVWAKRTVNGVEKQGWYNIQKSNNNRINGADLAEIYQSTEKLVPGDVVSIDPAKDNAIVKTKVAEDTMVAGVISTEPGVLMNQDEKGYKLALVGKVPTKVCNEGGAIKRGDLLVSASIPGYAKKAGDNPKVGTVIGKALENSDSQKGTILVLVNLQ
ncbi:hypothetical protein [Candidatus Ruminimicrobiellum ovillum]|uniref:hypothetical protein n=1 Tax=Candidatus Ruminimicrobiellum ovillum TaxID=1947927 RepID=UPI00355A932F